MPKKHVYTRTPDGRTIDYDQTPEVTDERSGYAKLVLLQPFVDACMMMLPDPPPRGRARRGLFLFFLGAADRLWQRLNLDDRYFPAFAESLLRRQGLPHEEALTLAYALPQVRENRGARDALIEGAQMFDLWMDSHDGNILLGLKELLLKWQHGSDMDLI